MMAFFTVSGIVWWSCVALLVAGAVVLRVYSRVQRWRAVRESERRMHAELEELTR